MNNKPFLREPVFNILKDAVIVTNSLNPGFELFPTFDYIMSSVFIKMTGCLEQKMKLICWEIASENADYRYKLLSNEEKLGECSNYNAKDKILRTLCEHYFLLADEKELQIPQKTYLQEIKTEMFSLLSGTPFKILFPRHFSEWINTVDTWLSLNSNYSFENTSDKLNGHLFGEGKWQGDIKNPIKIAFENMIRFRNAVAHNTNSPLKELPTIRMLQKPEFVYENYFLRFMICILTDKTFMSLFDKYTDCL